MIQVDFQLTNGRQEEKEGGRQRGEGERVLDVLGQNLETEGRGRAGG